MRLDGVRVLDLTRLLPGPYATQLLRDMGAEVIKVEDPEVGDYARFLEPLGPDGVGGIFSMVNRGKKSVTLNLKKKRGKEIFYDLVGDADVVIEQFRPGVAERLGVDYDSLQNYNSEIVYCSLSGYGQTGPYRDRAGHDLNYIGFAGLLDLTRKNDDDPPVIPGYPIADMSGGMFAAFSVVSALLERELGNSEGRYIDVSMTDVILSLSQAVAPMAMAGDEPRPGETPLTGKYACYNVYETADSRYVTLAALEPKFWEEFCTAVNREDLIDKHLSDDPETRQRVKEEVAGIFAEKTREEWEEILGDKDVCFGPVNTLNEAFENPQIRSRNMIKEVEEALPKIGFPAQFPFDKAKDEYEDAIPDMGEHTREVLKDQGLTHREIERLSDEGVI
ncbi:MAG: CaiB/BaiF CoA-transferase family protein [Halobacteria archaeon]|nr:CaiB/BaiF CoA-transferase family protein [Halobacteria archaeon]